MGQNKTQIRILIVDDEPLVHIGVATQIECEARSLGGTSFDFDYASNGCEALDKVAKENYHLIISDTNMPEMDGIEFLRALRASEDTTRFLLLFSVSFNHRGLTREKIFTMGANEICSKDEFAAFTAPILRKLL